ncbi:unnamed protein product [Symbiodinium natans]|uniref:Uncharacterized protein n=1 Tax=Symbiodinium natans TaxID=878477 RepID=A0A812NCP6_9DINO|nr:unnamed protein product [Symbiodinium natans]
MFYLDDVSEMVEHVHRKAMAAEQRQQVQDVWEVGESTNRDEAMMQAFLCRFADSLATRSPEPSLGAAPRLKLPKPSSWCEESQATPSPP